MSVLLGDGVGRKTLVAKYLWDNKGLLDQLIYGNGITVKHEYDKLNRQSETKINNVLRYQYTYDGSSRLLKTIDVLGDQKIKYDYDILDRLTTERILDTTTKTELAKLRIRYDDSKNRVSGYDVNIAGATKSTDYIYGELTKAPDIITGVKQNGTRILSYGYDALNRMDTRTISTTTPFVTEYEYLAGVTSGSTTIFVDTVKNGNDTLTYTYDNMGNITSVSKNGTLIESYTYDYLNQLKTVTRGSDTYEYIYDNGGNILSIKRNGEVIKTYAYGDTEWKDLLTAYNGESITYDTIGNPLTYRAGMNFTWTDGRKLTGITKGTDSISYTYDSNGLRNSKTVNGTTTEYYWLNGMLQGQKTGDEYILFLYDESGSVYGFILKNDAGESYYYYEFNLQGDIIGIIDSTGNKVVEYTYNEWGQLLSTTGTLADTIGQINPLRYRGYYYDAETGFYYVSSRYYDPEIGRFISADTTDVLDVQGDLYDKNLYAYCDNNPIMRVDYSGKVWITVGIMAVGGAIGGVIGAVSSAVTQKSLTGTVNWKSVIVAGVGGFVSGAVAASPLGVTGQVVAGSIIGSLSYVADCKVNKKSVAMDELAVATLGGTVSGIIGGPGANQNMALTKTIQTSIKTTTRMSSRACTTYAAKQIASTKAWRNNILTVNAMGSSARFAAGTGVSNVIASALSTVKGWFSKLFN